MCQGLSYFQLHSHNLVLTKLAPSSPGVNGGLCLLFYTNHNTASMTGISVTRGRQEECANQLTISSIFAHLQNLFQHRPSQDNATKESYDKRFVDVFDDTWSKSFRCSSLVINCACNGCCGDNVIFGMADCATMGIVSETGCMVCIFPAAAACFAAAPVATPFGCIYNCCSWPALKT